ncbi:MAG: 16S rRNA (uracil(1498)-N(3))-methyltransferase [Pseudomonadota bacterium]
MQRPRFFVDQPFIPGELIDLQEPVSRHISKALRMQIGDALCLFDGRGVEANGSIQAISRKKLTVRIEEASPIDRESSLEVSLAISMSRGDRMDTIVQKATELGVTRILPFNSERTELRLTEDRAAKKLAHWRAIAASACEQCGRNLIPSIDAPLTFQALLSQFLSNPASLKLLLHPGMSCEPLPMHCTELTLLIGPEGGFSATEVEQAIIGGFKPLSLGPRVLRTETAPLAAVAVAQARWGDLLAG